MLEVSERSTRNRLCDKIKTGKQEVLYSSWKLRLRDMIL